MTKPSSFRIANILPALFVAIALLVALPAMAFADTAVSKGNSSSSGSISATQKNTLTYSTHVQYKGWQDYVAEGATAGTTGQKLRLEAIKIKVQGNEYSGGIQYRTHVQKQGWQGWVKDDAISGTTGKGLRLEAIQIKLTGKLAEKYDVYYRAHAQVFGWMGWAKNGESAGTAGYGRRLEAVQIKLVAKGGKAPGSTANAFSKYVAPPAPKIPAKYKHYINKANKYSSRTNYIILVNCAAHKTVVLKGKKGSWEVVKFWSCTTGAPSTPTKKGVFSIQNKGISFGTSRYTCWYWSQWSGNYLFHSVKYAPGSKTRYVDGRLGVSASHGCVRLAINNAKWIKDNVPRGTKVVVY